MTAPTNEATIRAFFTGKGLDANAVDAILGNDQVESGFNPAASNSAEGAIGISQWEGGRRTALDAYASRTGGSETNLQTQLGYAWSELTGPYSGVLAQLRAGGTLQSDTQIVQSQFEGSNPSSLGARQAAAQAAAASNSATLTSSSPGGGGIGGTIGGVIGGILGGPPGEAPGSALGNGLGGAAANAAGGLASDAATGIVDGITAAAKSALPFFENVAAVIIGIGMVLIGLVIVAHAGIQDAGGNTSQVASKANDAVGKVRASSKTGESAADEAAEVAEV